jgi:hypothetical protein
MTNPKSDTTSLDAIDWPKHAAELLVSHNAHKNYYEKIDEAIGGDGSTYPRDEFPDEAEVQKAIATDSVWTIQWYPDTPVGFCRVCAATLSRALEHANAE